MSAIKRHIEAYAEQHQITFAEAQEALAAQDGVVLSPVAAQPTPSSPPPQTETVLTQGA